MTILGFIFIAACAFFLFTLPRRSGWIPVLIGATYLPLGLEVELGPAHFSALRILIIVGIVRVKANGERIVGGVNLLDKLMIGWGIWFCCSSVFHSSTHLVLRLGLVFDHLSTYFLFRVFLTGIEDLRKLFKFVCVLFIPLAVEMIFEKVRGRNLFSMLGGITEEILFRHGKLRAQGPFGTPILTGTAAAVCMPMAGYLWRQNRKLALVGILSSCTVVYACASSGPIMTALSIVGAMALWRIRGRLRAIRWMALITIIVLNFVMSDPVYFLLARIDITGGSTGGTRGCLHPVSDQPFERVVAGGTDVTRHWMVNGLQIGESNTDITNYYILNGVWGGLPLLFIFIAILAAAFAGISRSLRTNRNAPVESQFLIWTLGSILFGHAVTFLTISYFDQSIVFWT